MATCQVKQSSLTLCTANGTKKECRARYRAVVVTVTVSVTVKGPFPPTGTDVILELLAVGGDVDAGCGTAAAGAVESLELVLLARVSDDGDGCPGDENVSLGKEMTTGVCVDIVDGT